MDPAIAQLFDFFRQGHARARAAIQDLDADALNWVPGPDTSSIAVLVSHVMGSEGEVLRAIRGTAVPRDRAAEFRVRAAGPAELLAVIDAADALLEQTAAELTADDWSGQRARPGRPAQPGSFWLLRAWGHLSEHVAQLELTRQLYRLR